MTSLAQILLMILSVAQFLVIAHVIMSWLISFNIINLHQPLVRSVWNGLEGLLAPLYDPLRRMLPQMGGLDFAPLIVLLGIFALQTIVANNLLY